MEQFEIIKKNIGDEVNVRPAQLLCKELKIAYEDFVRYILVSVEDCKKNGYDSSLHFSEIGEDYELSQYACYLIVQKIPLIDGEVHAKIKNYFYTKDFAGRGIDKSKVHDSLYTQKGNEKRLKEREIWNVKRGINIGNESDGKGKYLRPVIVLKTIGSLFLAAPLTSKGKEGTQPYSHLYHKITSVIFEDCESYILLSQIKTIDKRRCIKKMEKISTEEFKFIKNLLRDMYFPEDS